MPMSTATLRVQMAAPTLGARVPMGALTLAL
jgi:hypothetical protein